MLKTTFIFSIHELTISLMKRQSNRFPTPIEPMVADNATASRTCTYSQRQQLIFVRNVNVYSCRSFATFFLLLPLEYTAASFQKGASFVIIAVAVNREPRAFLGLTTVTRILITAFCCSP